MNAVGRQIEVDVRLYDSGGALLGTITRTLAPNEYRQLNRVFEAVTPAVVDDGYAVVRTTTEGGAFFTLASVVGPTTWQLDLSERPDGTVVGTVAVGAAGKTLGDVTGALEIDTAICFEYPIAGTITVHDGAELITITFGPECNGSFDTTVARTQSAGYELLAVEWSFAGDTSTVGVVDSASGKWQVLGSSGLPRLNALARSPTGSYYSVTETDTCGPKRLIRIDPATGAGTVVGNLTGMPDVNYVAGLAFASNGTLYAAVGECNPGVAPDDELYRINPASGAATLVADLGACRA